MFKYTRNPNYLGEIMIYGSFVLLVDDLISYVCVMQVWFWFFPLRMTKKEKSLKQKEGWDVYKRHSWILLPKINGRLIDSLIFYALLAFSVCFLIQNGGTKSVLKRFALQGKTQIVQ